MLFAVAIGLGLQLAGLIFLLWFLVCGLSIDEQFGEIFDTHNCYIMTSQNWLRRARVGGGLLIVGSVVFGLGVALSL